ncbi:MAG: regulator of sigma E protease [Candidatus Midichloriaceae bacterium]
MTFFWFIVVITPIIFIHELGHFAFARMFGVKVEVFSIGFGKALFSWKDKKGTLWKICILPLGGYIKMYGDENAASTPDEEKLSKLSEDEKKMSFYYKNLWQKSLIIVGGPLANYLLAFIIFVMVQMYVPSAEFSTEITKVADNSAAEKVGLKAGDMIVKVGGEHVGSAANIKALLNLNVKKDIEIEYKRDGKNILSNVELNYIDAEDIIGEKLRMPSLGIYFGKYTHVDQGFFSSVKNSLNKIAYSSYMMLKSLSQIVTLDRSLDELGGPIKIAKYSEKMSQSGFWGILNFIAIISLTIGLMNLLPIPVLDGGHLLFYIIEGIIGRPMNMKIQKIAFTIGFVILISLMTVAIWNDLKVTKLFLYFKNII